jgi:Rieske Fe-S protein
MRALTRRGALRGSLVALLGAVGGYLAARDSTAARPPRGEAVANAYGPATHDGGRMLVAVDRVPVDGGVVLEKEKVVVTRPGPDDVRAFSAVCTHQG